MPLLLPLLMLTPKRSVLHTNVTCIYMHTHNLYIHTRAKVEFESLVVVDRRAFSDFVSSVDETPERRLQVEARRSNYCRLLSQYTPVRRNESLNQNSPPRVECRPRFPRAV